MNGRVKIVVAGAGYGGLMAALRLSRRRTRIPMDITLVNAGTEFVERIRLHQRIADQPLRRWSLDEFLTGTGIRFIEGRVEGLYPERQTIAVSAPGGERRLRYDRLVYALGSHPAKPTRIGGDVPVFAAGDAADAGRLLPRLRTMATSGGRVAVVGGGLTGIETAAELAESYPAVRVSLLTAARVGDGLGDRSRAHVLRTLRRLRVEVHEHTHLPVAAFDSGPSVDGADFEADLLVWAGPMRALPPAAEAGLPVNELDQIVVDDTLRSIAAPNIFAAGDAACVTGPGGRRLRMACATAMPLGAHAADNVAASVNGDEKLPFRYAYVGKAVSLGRRDGVIEFTRGDDGPTDRVVTGPLAAWIKEQICRSTITFLRWQRRGIPYHWLRGSSRQQASRRMGRPR